MNTRTKKQQQKATAKSNSKKQKATAKNKKATAKKQQQKSKKQLQKATSKNKKQKAKSKKQKAKSKKQKAKSKKQKAKSNRNRNRKSVCSVSALCPARNFSFTLEPDDGLCVRRCHCAKSNVQCASMACGWCVAQTLLLTRAAKTTSSTWRLSALPTAQEVSDQHFENSSYSPFDQQLAKRLAKQPGSSPSFGSLYELQTIWTENDHKSN